MATRRLAQFQQDVIRARDLIALGQSLMGMTHGRVDNTDLYRFGLVQAVAALDSYVHGISLDRAVDLLMGRLQTEPTESKIGLHFKAILDMLTTSSPSDRELSIRSHIAQRLSLETFQRPDAIATALSMVGIRKVWSSVYPGEASNKMTAIGVIVARRNRIVHECDNDLVSVGSVTNLSAADALDAIDTIEDAVGRIDSLC